MADKPDYKTYAPEQYAQNYDDDLSYEQHLITARHECCKRFLADKRPARVIEVGCGPSLLLDQMDRAFDFITHWHLVEPARTYADPAREKFGGGTGFGASFACNIGYFEEEIADITRDGLFDAVVLSGLIHETSEPELLIRTAHAALKPGGWVYVLAPNAFSMHRLLAHRMGLIDDPRAITERNVLMGQDVVYTPDSLKALLEDHGGFAEYEFSGHTLKLFTNAQMADILDRHGVGIAPALDLLGRDFAQNAAEIAWVARKRAP